MEIVITAILSIAVGALAGFLIGRSKGANATAEVEVLKERLREREEASNKLLEEKERHFKDQLVARENDFSERIKEREEYVERQHKEALDAMKSRFDETIEKLREQLANATAELLKERQREFEQSSREEVRRVITPVEESIKEMKAVMADNTLKHTEFGGALTANIQNLLRHSDAARESADRLANALRRSGKVQGEWGETVLTELLEMQGLKEGVHFDTQAQMRDESGQSVKSDEGAGLRPDVILHLDKNRDVIIDAKVSLSAYLDYINAETDEVRENALRNHADSVWKHVKELAAKDYSSYIQPTKARIGYVIMFVPNTKALYAALERRPDLWRKAMEMNVYIADEQTLYAALKIVSITWAQIAQTENHEKVYSLAEEMLKRVGMMMEKFLKIGKSLNEASKAYDEALAKCQDSGQSIPNTCAKLIKLGARPQPRKGVPDSMLGINQPEVDVNQSDSYPEIS